MNLSQLQRERDEWVARNFPGNELIDSFMGAVEEMGELAHALLKRKQGIRGSHEEHSANIQDSVADVVIFLAGIASHEGFDFGEAVEQAWNEVKARDWKKNRFDGGQLVLGFDPTEEPTVGDSW